MKNFKVKCVYNCEYDSMKREDFFTQGCIYEIKDRILYCDFILDNKIQPYSTQIKYNSVNDINKDMQLLGKTTKFELCK